MWQEVRALGCLKAELPGGDWLTQVAFGMQVPVEFGARNEEQLEVIVEWLQPEYPRLSQRVWVRDEKPAKVLALVTAYLGTRSYLMISRPELDVK